MRSVLLTVFLLAMFFSGLHGKSKLSDSSEESEPRKALRRSEISKALGLLKKHSVVGKNAKIVLKASGRNLLVDPSERLQVVSSHLPSSLETHKASASTNKASKLTAKTTAAKQKSKSTGKGNPKKRASGARASKESLNLKRASSSSRTNHTSPSQPTSSPLSLSTIQSNIMKNAASKSATIVDSLMGSIMLDETTRLVTAIVRNKRAHSLSELSDLITETLDDQFGHHWHTVSVATTLSSETQSKSKDNMAGSKSGKEAASHLNSLTHVAIDDHHKTSTFYVTYDFGQTLRIYIFK